MPASPKSWRRELALRSGSPLSGGQTGKHLVIVWGLPPLTPSGWKRGIIRPLHERPPTGGSHGKPHRTTKILSRARRRGGGVAARGARAARRADAAHRRAAAGSP